MEEKLVENLTMLCEVINGEYVSASKAQTGRFEVMKKAGSLQYPNTLYVSLQPQFIVFYFCLYSLYFIFANASIEPQFIQFSI